MYSRYVHERKGSRWSSLLSALTNSDIPEQQICACECAPGADASGFSEYVLGLWVTENGCKVSYYAKLKVHPRRWRKTETPAFTGYVLPWMQEYSDDEEYFK